MRTLTAALLVAALLFSSRPAAAYNQNLKTIGIISTFVGAGLFLTGVICLGAGYGLANPPAHLGEAGIGLTVLGAIGIGVGIPLWIIGGSGGGGGGGRAMLVPAANGFLVTF